MTKLRNLCPLSVPLFRDRAGAMLLCLVAFGCSAAGPGHFETPDAAIRAVSDVIGTGDEKRVEEIFGAGSLELFRSGDPVADLEDALRVKALINEATAFDYLDDRTAVVLLGAEEWPFAIPLVSDGQTWRFDIDAGREELLNRRIGENELFTIAALNAYVDAQREYQSESRDGKPPMFAAKLMSSEGRHDGLYWPAADGEEPSPMGEMVASASADGYAVTGEPGAPFHGYRFRILTRQGKAAPGGEMDYVDANGQLTGGFAAIAWPAKHGNSGVKTFLVNHRGIVFEKDLGPDTEALASAITSFDPDPTWTPTGH